MKMKHLPPIQKIEIRGNIIIVIFSELKEDKNIDDIINELEDYLGVEFIDEGVSLIYDNIESLRMKLFFERDKITNSFDISLVIPKKSNNEWGKYYFIGKTQVTMKRFLKFLSLKPSQKDSIVLWLLEN